MNRPRSAARGPISSSRHAARVIDAGRETGTRSLQACEQGKAHRGRRRRHAPAQGALGVVGAVDDHQRGAGAEPPRERGQDLAVGDDEVGRTATALPGGGSSIQLDDGATIVSNEAGSGRVGVAIHPWDISLALESPPSDERRNALESPPSDERRNALAGAVGATTLHGGRTRVRIGALLAETGASAPELPERGTPAYAIFEPTAVRVVPLRLPSEASNPEEPS
jgi:hypothetical protein